MTKKYNILSVLSENDGIAIQAEIVGPGIQGNKMKLPDTQIRVFDVWVTKQGRYMDYAELVAFCQKYSLPMVPVLKVTMMTPEKDVNYWLEKARGYYEGTESFREGIVIRNTKSRYIRDISNRASFKALNNDFLLKHKE
jgi:ATP-dependent RNA circularization protein (DNA/RNA ligase family)